MSNLFKRLFALQILKKYQRVPLQYKLIFACLFPHIFLSSCTIDPVWICTYITKKGESVTVEWDPNKEPGLPGYKIYYGLESQIYNYIIDVGNTTMFTLSELHYGETYYIAATAYNKMGYESELSEEIVYNAPGEEDAS